MDVVQSVKQGVRDKGFPQCVEHQRNVEHGTSEDASSVGFGEALP